MKRGIGIPEAQGLYNPEFEKDNCGIGMVTDIKGRKSNKIVKMAVQVLERLEHRGAVGADPTTGDGAGVLIQIPDEFFRKKVKNLPEEGKYGVGMIFFPQNKVERNLCEEIIEKIIIEEKQEIITWRDIPINKDQVGKTAELSRPYIKQIFIKKSQETENFELRLYIIRKRIENKVRELKLEQEEFFYIPSMSSKTIVYKGLLLANQSFYKDLEDETVKSSIALIHQRYSTNTFPSWDLAQPFRYLIHNGEINTVKGNINWMTAREPELFNEVFRNEISKIFPVQLAEKSDSANLDNAIELMLCSGKSLLEVASIMIPPAWEKNTEMSKEMKDYYEYYSGLIEPWDGPASLVMTDGTQVLGKLDRNGLRPARYLITKDDIVILASEAGTIDIDPADIKENGRLQPGKVLLIDTKAGRILSDEEIEKNLFQNQILENGLKRKKF